MCSLATCKSRAVEVARYLNPERYQIKTYPDGPLIFPFGGNASQFKAVENALTKQISVIQGPPGTGKTQTILNIIANLLIRNKTIQVVSNNNSATQNVLEKLASPKYNMDFLVATLGKHENKQLFIASQTGSYPNMESWEKTPQDLLSLRTQVESLSKEVAEYFGMQERLAVAKQELDALEVEYQYFCQLCENTNFVLPTKKPRPNLRSKIVLLTLQECEILSEEERTFSLWHKFKSTFIHEAVVATDNASISDTFDPILTALAVTFNGVAWTQGVQYNYNEVTGLFTTVPGQILVPAATYSQDPVIGVYSATPGISTLVVTGTI